MGLRSLCHLPQKGILHTQCLYRLSGARQRTHPPSDKMAKKPLYKSAEAKKLRSFFLSRYFDYVANYDKILEKKFPAAMNVYRVFIVGIRDFYADLKAFLRVVRILNAAPGKFAALNRREIELYDQMPRDMLKIAPVLLISALPFANYVIFPLAYLFPRQLLCSHFWSLQQRAEFATAALKRRLRHNRPLFRCLQAELECVQEPYLRQEWGRVLGLLGSGVQPTTHDILRCRELFSGPPYHLNELKPGHVKQLLKVHNLHSGWYRRSRLADRALILAEMDRAIIREGGVHNLPADALSKACWLRGLNPANMRNADMVDWLSRWVTVSKSVDSTNLSLLLHSPILLGYNMPSNWTLVYLAKRRGQRAL